MEVWFLCLQDLTIVHRYAGGVIRYHKGQKVSAYDLQRNGVRNDPAYFVEIDK